MENNFIQIFAVASFVLNIPPNEIVHFVALKSLLFHDLVLNVVSSC